MTVFLRQKTGIKKFSTSDKEIKRLGEETSKKKVGKNENYTEL